MLSREVVEVRIKVRIAELRADAARLWCQLEREKGEAEIDRLVHWLAKQLRGRSIN